MRGVNHVVLMGYVGGKPSGKVFPNGGVVTNFRLATKHQWTDQTTGQRFEETDWHNITGYNNFASIANKHLSKGAIIMIHGSLRTREWQDQYNETHYKTEIVMNYLEMLSPGEEEPQQQPKTPYKARQQRQQRQQSPYNGGQQNYTSEYPQSRKQNSQPIKPTHYRNQDFEADKHNHRGSQEDPHWRNWR